MWHLHFSTSLRFFKISTQYWSQNVQGSLEVKNYQKNLNIFKQYGCHVPIKPLWVWLNSHKWLQIEIALANSHQTYQSCTPHDSVEAHQGWYRFLNRGRYNSQKSVSQQPLGQLSWNFACCIHGLIFTRSIKDNWIIWQIWPPLANKLSTGIWRA